MGVGLRNAGLGRAVVVDPAGRPHSWDEAAFKLLDARGRARRNLSSQVLKSSGLVNLIVLAKQTTGSQDTCLQE